MGRNALLSRCARRSLFTSAWLGRTDRTPRPNILDTPSPSYLSSSFSSSSFPSSFRYLVRIQSLRICTFSSAFSSRSLNTKSSSHSEENDDAEAFVDEAWEGEISDICLEEDEAEPELGDGGAGGGVLLGCVPWGERVLSIAQEILLQFGDDMKLYAFKTTTQGNIYVRLDKPSDRYGCPSMEELESFNNQYRERLEETGQKGEIPNVLGVQVSSPGANRILKVPDDLDRFKDMPMRVCYLGGELESKCAEKEGYFLLESIETELGHCVWKMADVKKNRGLLGKGRPLNRKQKDWRLKLPYASLRKVSLYIN